jgi:hypothetical protein
MKGAKYHASPAAKAVLAAKSNLWRVKVRRSAEISRRLLGIRRIFPRVAGLSWCVEPILVGQQMNFDWCD